MVAKMTSEAGAGRATVLVVEDEPSVAMLETEVLERAGFEVEQVSLGRRALEIIEPKGIEVVVADFTMPDMTGADFLTELRRSSQVPVIAVTGHSNPEVEALMREAGAFEFLVKDPGLKFLDELPKAVAAAITTSSENPSPGQA